MWERIELDPHDSTNVARWQSPGARWVVRVTQVLYGFRVQVQERTDNLGFLVVYCAGRNRLTLLLLPAVVMTILDGLGEHATNEQVMKAFPEQNVKPMYRDPPCWRLLCSMAGVDAIDLTDHDIEESRPAVPAEVAS
jgi:hypothetical protein